uniref:Putative secreted protein n=1 Tax=Amblyomma americanum TaxID=6943 RepID=A0A0C9R676_AMBAM
MFFVAALISVFALFAAESTDTSLHKEEKKFEIYNNTFKAVRRKGSLHLLWYSHELEKNITKCLSSEFLTKTKYVSRRTFEVNEKPEDLGKSKPAKTNISVFVHPATPYPTITVQDDKGLIPRSWSAHHQVLNASSHCFVLRALVIPTESTWKSYCVVFGEKSYTECFEMVKKDCTNGTEVDLAQCEVIKRNRKEMPPPKEC